MTETPKAPEGMSTLSPHLVCDGAAAAIDFYARAFNAVELMRIPGQNGKLMHAAVSINGASVMLVDENLEHGMLGPKALNGTPVTLHLLAPDVDKLFAQAVAAGAEPFMPPTDMFWGDRYAMVKDPFGHRWAMATPIRTLSVEEMQEAARAAMPDFAKD